MNIHSPILRLIAAVLATLTLSVPVHAQIVVQIQEGREAATPIGVIPFGFSGAGAPPRDDIAQIVADDLTRSGFFAPVPRADLPSRPSDLSQIDYADWRLLRTTHLVVGRCVRSQVASTRWSSGSPTCSAASTSPSTR